MKNMQIFTFHALLRERKCDILTLWHCVEVKTMDIAKRIRELRESVGENRTEFSKHTGIPVRTIEDWESGRRTPPEYIPRLIAYQMEYERLVNKSKKG